MRTPDIPRPDPARLDPARPDPARPDPARRGTGERLALVGAGLLLLAGGGQHPDADASGTLREELATMTADPSWVPGHALVVASTVLLAVGLRLAARRGGWPARTQRALHLAALAVALYVLETVTHLAAVVDSDVLREGGTPVVAYTHIGLSLVLYPLAGIALANLGVALLRTGSGLRRMPPLLLVVAGVLHAVAVPFTVLLPYTENTPLFAGSAVLLAVWSVLTGLSGLPGRRAPLARAPRVPVAA